MGEHGIARSLAVASSLVNTFADGSVQLGETQAMATPKAALHTPFFLRLDALRKKIVDADGNELSGRETCARAGLNPSHYSQWKAGAMPNEDTVKKLASFFSVKAGWLLFGEEESPDVVDFDRLHDNFRSAVQQRAQAGRPYRSETIRAVAQRAFLSGPALPVPDYQDILDDEERVQRRIDLSVAAQARPIGQSDLDDLGPPKKKAKR